MFLTISGWISIENSRKNPSLSARANLTVLRKPNSDGFKYPKPENSGAERAKLNAVKLTVLT